MSLLEQKKRKKPSPIEDDDIENDAETEKPSKNKKKTDGSSRPDGPPDDQEAAIQQNPYLNNSPEDQEKAESDERDREETEEDEYEKQFNQHMAGLPTDQELLDMEGGDTEQELENIPNPFILNEPPLYKTPTNFNATGSWNDDNAVVNRKPLRGVAESIDSNKRLIQATRLQGSHSGSMNRMYQASKMRAASDSSVRRRARAEARASVRNLLTPTARNWDQLGWSDKEAIDRMLNNTNARQMLRSMSNNLHTLLKQREHHRINSMQKGVPWRTNLHQHHYRLHTSLGESTSVEETLSEEEAFELVDQNIDIICIDLLENRDSNLMRLLRHGLIRDQGSIQQYLRALQDPVMATKQTNLRERLLEILNKLLDMILETPSIYRLVDLELQKKRNYAPSHIKEELEEVFDSAFFEFLTMEGWDNLTALQYASNAVDSFIDQSSENSLVERIMEPWKNKRWTADRKEQVLFAPEKEEKTGKRKRTSKRRADFLAVSGRHWRPDKEEHDQIINSRLQINNKNKKEG